MQAQVGSMGVARLAVAFHRAAKVGSDAVGTGHAAADLLRMSPSARVALGSVLRQLRRLSERGPSRGELSPEEVYTPFYEGTLHEPDMALREARWNSLSIGVSRRALGAAPPPSVQLRAAVQASLSRADALGIAWAGPRLLLENLLADRDNNVAELLRSCGVDAEAVLDVVRNDGSVRDDDAPSAPTVAQLGGFDLLHGDFHVPGQAVARVGGRALRLAGVDPMAFVLEQCASRQAVRLGSAGVTTVHLLLAVLALDRELDLTNTRVSGRYRGVSRGGEALAACDLSWAKLARTVGDPAVCSEPMLFSSTARWWRKRPARAWRSDPNSVRWSVSAAEAAERVILIAQEAGTPVGSSHVVCEALAIPDSAARRVLSMLNVDPEMAHHLARQYVSSGVRG